MRRHRLLPALLLLLTACGNGGGASEVVEDPSPRLAASPGLLVFTGVENGADPQARTVRLDNAGQGELAWQASENLDWLSLTDATGTAGESFGVAASVVGRGAGTYQGFVTVTDPAALNSPYGIPVTLTVSPVMPPPPSPSCGCESLPAPTGSTTTVSTVATLRSALTAANDGTGPKTILVEDGTYHLDQLLHVTGDDVTVRGASGDRDAVVLEGDGMTGGVSHVFLVRGSRFTAADLTIGWIANHAIQVQGEQDADDALIHNVRFVDTGEQMLKISYDSATSVGAHRGIVRCCLFEYTAGIGPQYYIGGIDGHQCTDWVIQQNVFRGIRSPEAALAEHAIHFWSDSTGTLVEKNVIVDCDRGIGFGLGSRGHGSGVIVGNMVYTTRDVGIGLENAAGVSVAHNSVVTEGYANAIEYRFAGTDATLVNNLTAGAVALRDGATGTEASNVTVANPYALFVDTANGDLRLVAADPSVVDQGQALASVTDDIDCDARPNGALPDAGADEWVAP